MQGRGRGGWPGWSSPLQQSPCAPLLGGYPPSGYIWAPTWRDKVQTKPGCRTGPCRPAWPAGGAAATASSSSWCSWRRRSCTTRSPSTDPASVRWGSWCWSTHWCSPSSWASKWPRWHQGHPGAPGRTPGFEQRRTAWLSPPRPGRSWQQIIPQLRLQRAATRGEMRSEVSVGAWRTHSWGCWWESVSLCLLSDGFSGGRAHDSSMIAYISYSAADVVIIDTQLCPLKLQCPSAVLPLSRRAQSKSGVICSWNKKSIRP